MQAEREKKALEERVSGLSVIETEHGKLLDRAQGLNEAQERSAILLQQKDDELRTSSREQEELARQILVEAEVKAQLERQLENLKVTARQHEELQRQIPNMNKLEARNSSLQHQVEMLKRALRTQEETKKGGDSVLALQQRVDAMTAKDAKTQAELQTRADVISKLEESNGALQQKRLTEAEWQVQDTRTANHVQALVAQMEEERTIQAAGHRAHQAVLARRAQEQRLDERTHLCAVRELTKLMSEMRGEWAQPEGTMANPVELGAPQGGYVREKSLRNVAPQRTNLEEALMADREAASSRDPTVKPWETDPEAASTRAPSADEEKGNEEAHRSGAQKTSGCQRKAKHKQKKRKKRVGMRTDENHMRKW